MRVLGVLLLLVAVASAQEKEAADQVLAAFKAKDAKALKALAEKANPDPWVVADLLCYRGEHDAAAAFAKAAPRVDTEKLPAYVEAWRKREPDKADRELLAAMNAAMANRQPQKVIEATKALEPAMDTLIGVRLRHCRGTALGFMRQWDECATVMHGAAEAARALGWVARAAHVYEGAGIAAYRGSDWARARSSFSQQLALQERRGDKAGVTGALVMIGNQHLSLGEYAKALGFHERGLELAQEIGHRPWAGMALIGLGNVHHRLGNHAQALAANEQALTLFEALGDKRNAAVVLGNIGNVYRNLGDFQKALATYEQALADHKALGNRNGAAQALQNIGGVHHRLGDSQKALATLQQARTQFEALGDKHGATLVLGNIGSVYSSLGDYAKALATYEQALAEHKALGERHAVAVVLGNIGIIHGELGDYEKALATYEQALAEKKAVGDKRGAALTLGNIGLAHSNLGDYAKALATYEQALAEHKALGSKDAAALTLGNIGFGHRYLGDYAKALATYEQALAEHRALGDKRGAALTLGGIADAYRGLGDHAKALAAFKRSADEARSLRATPVFVAAQRGLARLHLQAGKPARALAAAQKALDALEDVLGGLGEEQGATARAQYASLFGIGTLAAVGEEDAADAVRFLESGRAGALLDTLDKRETLRWKAESLSPELRRLDLEAQAKAWAARRAYDAAVKGGKRKEIRSAAAALDGASENVRAVAGRIQRALKQQAGLFYPRPKTIYAIRDALVKDQVLVLYGFFLDDDADLDEALALVLRQDGERVVSLGKATDVAAACEALDATDPEVDPAAALGVLRKLLVEPLKLGADVKQVLVSPEGPLCYVPFGALFTQAIAMTPSGTTHVLLLGEERAKGEGILALGDPDYKGASKGAQAIYYRGRTLSPLPATRKEAEAIGTTTLLGAKASEAGLYKALKAGPSFAKATEGASTPSASRRWRAVHFACHGLVDVDRPMLSSLALAREGEQDGFLTALEILRTKIPADLAVLSACETARGKIVKGEGIVGLTRAFMFAGTPRVICSLWKVDDEATQALMVKFYELWKTQPTATALQNAQAFVRGHDKWKHPYYWAAWQLWGLGD